MELLKALFESAELPADFKEKTTTLFEAAVDEKVKAELVTIQESYDQRLETAKGEFVAEAVATVDAAVEEAILEWAKENAVALDSQIKSQIAESFLQNLKSVFEKADIELTGDTAGKELVKLQEQNAELVKAADAAKAQLTEAQEKLTQIKIKEIIAEVTEGLADTQVHRVSKLVEAFAFKSEEDFRNKAALVVEAVTGAPLKQEARGTTPAGPEFNGTNNGTPTGGYSAKPAPAIKGTYNVDGSVVTVTGDANVSNKVDTSAGAAGPDDGELVKKPVAASNKSGEGNDGTPDSSQVITQPDLPNGTPNMRRDPPGLREQMERDAAPHLHSDLVAETMKLFRK